MAKIKLDVASQTEADKITATASIVGMEVTKVVKAGVKSKVELAYKNGNQLVEFGEIKATISDAEVKATLGEIATPKELTAPKKVAAAK